MVEIYSIVSIILGIFFISLSIIKLKKQSIQQSTFVVWTVIGIIAILIGSIPVLAERIRDFLGTELSVSAILGITTIFLAILVFYLHHRIDDFNQKITKLVTELAANKFYKPPPKDKY